jgi:hypothetical protein
MLDGFQTKLSLITRLSHLESEKEAVAFLKRKVGHLEHLRFRLEREKHIADELPI